ncbi:MAG: RNB domain-containing ribonuclease [Actinomycetia bacterium]|nr:RNB domain-containing ribonuclease [Actinomycetes bacterium]
MGKPGTAAGGPVPGLMARHTPGRSRSGRRRAQLARAGLIPAGDPTGRSANIAGVIVRRGKSLEVEPLFQPGPSLPVERSPVRPQPGDLVLFTFSYGFKAQIVRPLGKSNVLGDVLEALLADSLTQRGFSPKVLAEAAVAAGWNERTDPYRTDLRDVYTFTIDPVTAQDFDDALSFERTTAGTTVVYVHIADVSYFVQEGTALDREALRRGNSVYVATGVEPMLPPQLSSGVCSLRPGEDRKAVTVEMELDDQGRVLRSAFYRSLIRSDRRMDYEQVERMFRGSEPTDPELRGPLDRGRTLAQTLREVRGARGSLHIESTEPEFEWDDKGQVVAADPSEELESHRLIENFMVLANEQVASFLEREHVPTVYRVHDLPDPFNLERLLDTLAGLGLPTPAFDALEATPQEIRRVARGIAEWVDRYTPAGKGKAALVQQVLRAQARAVYQTVNIGHFGLASQTYCHFTSPIRRYPDLLVHRGLLGRLGLGPEPSTTVLEDWAEHCSITEREAAKIELKADDIVLAHLLKRRLDEDGRQESVFEGQVLSLTRRGMFVLFERLFQGYLPVSELPGDYYDLNELETALVGRRSGRAYKLADLLPVRVTAVDEARGRVDLALAGDADEDDDLDGRDTGAAAAGRNGSVRERGRGGGRSRGGGPGGGRPALGGRLRGSGKTKTTRTRAPQAARPPQGRGRR